MYALTRMKIVMNQMPNGLTWCLFCFPKICGIRFVRDMPAKILERPCTVEFCVLTTASAETNVIHTWPGFPSSAMP